MKQLHEILVGIKKAILQEDLPAGVTAQIKTSLKRELPALTGQYLDSVVSLLGPDMAGMEIAQVIHDETGDWLSNEVVDEITVLIQDKVHVESKDKLPWATVRDSREYGWKGYRGCL